MGFFKNSSMMLFLNKRDLFEEKIKIKKITDNVAFSDYKGPPNNYDAGVKYFIDKFKAKNRGGKDRQIYHNVTCATDTKNIRIVFDACKDIILRQAVADMGF